ncbi:MAG: PIN domain-containing protein [Thermoproteus sp.]
MRLVLDTSSIIYIIEKRLDVSTLTGHVLFTTYSVVEELFVLATRRRGKARVALRVLKLLAPFVVDVGGPADRSVITAAARVGGCVLSGDAEVVAEARRRGVPVALFHDRDLVFPP